MILDRRQFIKTLGALTLATRLRFFAWAQGAQRFILPPTIQHISEESAVLYFRLANPTTDGRVVITQDGETTQEIAFATADSLRHQILIEGLQSATTYGYKILIDGAELSTVQNDLEPWTALTFSTPPYEFPLRIAAVGDSGFGDSTTVALGQQMAAHNPHLFFHLGDVVYHMHQYNNDHFLNWHIKYFKPFYPLLQRVPHYPTFGNHELDSPAILDGWSSYYWVFPPFNADQYLDARMWYGFDYNGIQFLSLNSQLFYSQASLRAEQEAWLDAKLARDDVLYTVVFFHVTPFTSAGVHQFDGQVIAQQWSPKFENSNVALVLAGHAHVYERLQQNGLTYITAGAGSSTLYGQGERLGISQFFYSGASYPIVDLYPDRVQVTAYDVNGNVIDEVDILL